MELNTGVTQEQQVQVISQGHMPRVSVFVYFKTRDLNAFPFLFNTAESIVSSFISLHNSVEYT